jgi:hypothetical protein
MPHGGRQIAIRDEHGSLREEIEQGYCDFLVMGGCSRPMWVEFVFGGPLNQFCCRQERQYLSHIRLRTH